MLRSLVGSEMCIRDRTIANWLFFRNNVAVAVAKPRIHCQLFPPTVVYEPTFPKDLLAPIGKYKHEYVTNSTYDVSGELNQHNICNFLVWSNIYIFL